MSTCAPEDVHIPTTDQSDAGSVGIFSWRTNQTQETLRQGLTGSLCPRKVCTWGPCPRTLLSKPPCHNHNTRPAPSPNLPSQTVTLMSHLRERSLADCDSNITPPGAVPHLNLITTSTTCL
eukprot:4790635-Pyramimonas_sp.AAC.1